MRFRDYIGLNVIYDLFIMNFSLNNYSCIITMHYFLFIIYVLPSLTLTYDHDKTYFRILLILYLEDCKFGLCLSVRRWFRASRTGRRPTFGLWVVSSTRCASFNLHSTPTTCSASQPRSWRRTTTPSLRATTRQGLSPPWTGKAHL